MEMQHTYEEQQSHMDSMIRQVALLAEMIKEVKENRAKSEEDGNAEVEEGVRRADEKKPAEAEEESEALPEEAEVEEIKTDEEGVQTEEKSITKPLDDGAPREILEEERDELSTNEEAIKCDEEIENTPLYLQPSLVHVLDEKVEEFTITVKKESTPAEEPPPEIDQLEGCSYEEEEP